MTNCIFYSLIFVLFLNFSVGSIKYSQVNRTFMSIYKGVFEASLITIDESGHQIEPFYNKAVLEHYLVTYLKDNLDKYDVSYKVKIYYFDRDNNELCYDERCRDVNVTLKANINYFFKYEKSQNFSVLTREEYGK